MPTTVEGSEICLSGTQLTLRLWLPTAADGLELVGAIVRERQLVFKIGAGCNVIVNGDLQTPDKS